MKSLLSLLFITAITLAACSGNPDKVNAVSAAAMGDSTSFTSIQWIDSARDMGKISEGQKLQISFRFKNTGDRPLVIESVRPGCGCTVADYPKEPIAPGDEGEITGSFDSKGREGMQHKEIMVTANTKGSQEHHVYFNVEVVKAKS